MLLNRDPIEREILCYTQVLVRVESNSKREVLLIIIINAWSGYVNYAVDTFLIYNCHLYSYIYNNEWPSQMNQIMINEIM